MTGKRLSALCAKINIEEEYGSGDPVITSLAYDSRDVNPGSLFFALRGIHADGHGFIDKAIEQGARAVICMEMPSLPVPSARYIRVADSRTAMSPIAAAFFDNPSEELKIIGVTGTDGKSTTSYFIQQLIEKSGRKCGLLTTVQFDFGDGPEKNFLRQSTPEATEIHRLLRRMRDNGCSYAVVEATSHGLSPVNNRLGDVRFDAGVLTNISHEHLEFHKTLERYMDDKANLFRALPADTGAAVINLDEPRREVFSSASACPVFTYSLEDDLADLFADDILEKNTVQQFNLHHHKKCSRVQLSLPGRFNVENCLAALLGASLLTGTALPDLLPAVSALRAIRGRMVPVDCGQPFQVIVDYAHTPGSFRKLFPGLRNQTEKRLIAVFGSAGERDLEKRPIQGEIASEFCDIIILTDEDPRGDEPQDILEEIAAGCSGMSRDETLYLIEDRPAAIRKAFSLAREGDTVILLGKGHEGSIIYQTGPVPWDEEKEAIRALNDFGYKSLKKTV